MTKFLELTPGFGEQPFPWLLFARMNRFLDLYSRFYADLNISARIYATQLDVVTSVFDETRAKMIGATRRIFYMQNLKPS